MSKRIRFDHSRDGLDRRGFLECMAWVGTGVLYTLHGGLLSSSAIGDAEAGPAGAAATGLQFVQLSDSHIGFSKEANPDVTETLRVAVERVNALRTPPAFVLHTGDISHLSRPDQWDTAVEVLKTIKAPVFYVPGEHDVIGDAGASYVARFAAGGGGKAWYSFDRGGVHFVGLANVLDLQPGGMGRLGPDQLGWLAKDLAGLSASTPVVVFAHVPLWSIYPEWGWGTSDSEQALQMLRRFGSVTVLNGHIHQVMQKVEGHVAFHTAMSTAFPQPAPGTAPSPGPMKVEAGRLRSVLGLTSVNYVPGAAALALIDATLASGAPAAQTAPGAERATDTARAAAPGTPDSVSIDNFTFTPAALEVHAGTTVTWVNRDDIPHTVVSDTGVFKSKPLDTDDKFSFRFEKPGRYPYFCSIHPHMKGSVAVT